MATHGIDLCVPSSTLFLQYTVITYGCYAPVGYVCEAVTPLYNTIVLTPNQVELTKLVLYIP